MRWTISGWVLCAALGGCASGSASPRAEAGDCSSGKLAFTRATACQNDGSVELCLPRDEQVVQRVRGLAPELQGPVGGAGRARCDLMKEALYFIPMPEGCRETGALPEETWARLCRVAADPAVARIVPTWYE
jgi:hypothetical protein